MKASRQPKRGPVVLDTGPLLTYLALLYLDSIEAKKAYRDALFSDIRGEKRAFGETEQERFGAWMAASRPLLTTAHIMAEVTKLRAYSGLAKAGEFRSFSLDVLAGDTFSETTFSLAELYGEPRYMALTRRFGVTDAGLLLLADRNGYLPLTDDTPLFDAHSSESRFEIRLLDEYLREVN
jgi:hypothetical protein